MPPLTAHDLLIAFLAALIAQIPRVSRWIVNRDARRRASAIKTDADIRGAFEQVFAELQTAKKERDRLQVALRNSKTDRVKLRAENDLLREQNLQKDEKIEHLESKVAALEGQVKTLQQEIQAIQAIRREKA